MRIGQVVLMIGKSQAQGEHPFSIDVKGGEFQIGGRCREGDNYFYAGGLCVSLQDCHQ
jgi:hypothetical protein